MLSRGKLCHKKLPPDKNSFQSYNFPFDDACKPHAVKCCATVTFIWPRFLLLHLSCLQLVGIPIPKANRSHKSAYSRDAFRLNLAMHRCCCCCCPASKHCLKITMSGLVCGFLIVVHIAKNSVYRSWVAEYTDNVASTCTGPGRAELLAATMRMCDHVHVAFYYYIFCLLHRNSHRRRRRPQKYFIGLFIILCWGGVDASQPACTSFVRELGCASWNILCAVIAIKWCSCSMFLPAQSNVFRIVALDCATRVAAAGGGGVAAVGL